MSRSSLIVWGLFLAGLAAPWAMPSSRPLARPPEPVPVAPPVSARRLPPPVAADHAARVIVLSPAGPLLIDLLVRVDGKTVRSIREDTIDRMLAQADTNFDGVSTWREAVENRRFAGGGFHRARIYSNDDSRMAIEAYAETMDKNGNGLLDRDEAEDVCNLGEPPFCVTRDRRYDVPAPDLFARLDTNHDGVLAAGELTGAAGSILGRDSNRNEWLEPFEYEAVPDGRRWRSDDPPPILPDLVQCLGGPSFGPSPRRDLAAEARLRELLRQTSFSSRWDTAFDSAPLRSWKELRQALMRSADFRTPGKIDRWEVRSLQTAAAHLTIEVRYSIRDHQTELAIRQVFAPLTRHISLRPDGEIELVLPGKTVRIAAAPNSCSLQSSLKWLFQTDKDHRGTMEPAEVRGRTFDFVLADTDRNFRIDATEALAYYEQDWTPCYSRLSLGLGDATTPVLRLLDTHRDEHLSLREILAAPARLASCDLDRDGRVQADEIPQSIAITLAYGYFWPDHPREHDRPKELEVAEWFRRMDRNQDGDLSPREFLGPRAEFDRLDANRDGLVSGEESPRMKSR